MMNYELIVARYQLPSVGVKASVFCSGVVRVFHNLTYWINAIWGCKEMSVILCSFTDIK